MSTETYYSGDVSRTMSTASNDVAQSSAEILASAFPWFRQGEYYSVSTPAYHEVLGEPVITCCLPLASTDALVGQGYALGARKFCVNSKTSFLRLYKLFTEDPPTWLPKSAKVLFSGDNHREYGRPYNELCDGFTDIYFSGNPADVEAHFNLPERRGAYETFYGATIKDGKPSRVKQYIYDEQGGFSDWDVIWLMHEKRRLAA